MTQPPVKGPHPQEVTTNFLAGNVSANRLECWHPGCKGAPGAALMDAQRVAQPVGLRPATSRGAPAADGCFDLRDPERWRKATASIWWSHADSFRRAG